MCNLFFKYFIKQKKNILFLIVIIILGIIMTSFSNNYPVFSDLTGGFLPVNKALVNYVGIEIGICFVALIISTVLFCLYIKVKK